MLIQPGSKLLMIGDSITDCSRTKPVGEGVFDGLGNGYVNLVNALLDASCPDRRIRVVNTGTSGNTVRDLKARWQTDVIDLKPDWLSVMIGINDVWRQFDCPLQTEWGVPLDEYERTLEELITAVRPSLKGLVMMTPYYIEANRQDAMRATMDRYGAVVQQIAARNEARFVDTQAVFDRQLQYTHSTALAWDRVHPHLTGHMLLAKAFLQAVEFEY